MQHLPTDWEWFVKNVLPVVQLFATMGGAVLGAWIGGWVAIKTTTKALQAAAERELVAQQAAVERELKAQLAAAEREQQTREATAHRERVARAEERCDAAADRLRINAERYMDVLWKIYSHQADLAASISAKTTGREKIEESEFPSMQPPSKLNAELLVLEQLHLRFLDGHAFSIGDLLTIMGRENGGVIVGIRAGLTPPSEQLATFYARSSWDHLKTLKSKIDAAAALLRKHVDEAERHP